MDNSLWSLLTPFTRHISVGTLNSPPPHVRTISTAYYNFHVDSYHLEWIATIPVHTPRLPLEYPPDGINIIGTCKEAGG